jgi:glyoxylase-like metal-dependent hydrolase (beta-lactamase superfamily II)
MKLIPIVGKNNVYTSNVYMVTGDWKRIEDQNTLVDVGNDPSIIEIIGKMNGGAGKKKVDQVVLTHSHYDHTNNLPLIKAAFHPIVYAFSPFMEGVDHILKNGDIIRMGDRDFEVFHAPGHSSDSICLYNKDDGDLFVGDVPVVIRSVNSSYENEFYEAMTKLCRRDVKTIYFGHGEPLVENALEVLRTSLQYIRESIQ